MVFNSLSFLVFFAVVLALHHLPLSWRAKKINLLVASYLFYAGWYPPFVLLLLTSTVVDWFAASAMAGSSAPARRRAWLCVSLATNLGLLGFFKYGDFIIANTEALLAAVGLPVHYEPLGIILPIGISFYTFQTLSYTLDVYRGTLRPAKSPLDFALFVSFFPQLVAGPIVRAAEFLPQCRESRAATARQLGWGLTLLLVGLVEKDLADHLLAPVADAVYVAGATPGFRDAWIGTLAFAGQIFFDFAGYSTCAIGVALCIGFELPDNFRFPYASIGFSDFWRRWHISLSGWLRDYLYISLGGNRRGTVRTYVNLMLTMLIGGLWHGAAWTFVIWGGLHGLYLVIERPITRHVQGSWLARVPGIRGAAALLTFAAVCVTWVFFRAQTFGSAFHVSGAMLGFVDGESILGRPEILMVSLITVGLLAGQWLLRDASLEQLAARLPWWARGLAIAAGLVTLVVLTGDDRAFIYFQF